MSKQSETALRFAREFFKAVNVAAEFGIDDPKVFAEDASGELFEIEGIAFSHLNGGQIHIEITRMD